MIKKLLVLLFLGLVASGAVYAQKHGGKSREEMRKDLCEFKMKFMAQEMDLKEDQQKQFSEVYTRMSNERFKLFEQTRSLERKLKKDDNATEEDYANFSRAMTETKEKDMEIEKRYDAELSKFLTGKQIFKMKRAEEKFRQKMSEMKHKKKSKK